MGEPTTNTTPGQEEAPLNMFEGKMGRRQAIGGFLQLLGLKVAADATNAMAQDPAVAVATPNNNPRTVGTPEKMNKSGFSKKLDWLRSQIDSLSTELDKWKINVGEFIKLIDWLSVNEPTMVSEVTKALDIAFIGLGKTYRTLGATDKKKTEIKDRWILISDTKLSLTEDLNLIKAMRLICKLREDFRTETAGINQAYFDGILKLIDKVVDVLMLNIQNSGKEFGQKQSPELESFLKEIGEMKWALKAVDVEAKKGAVDIEMKTVKDGGIVNINWWFKDIAHGDVNIEDGKLKLKFNQSWDCLAVKTEAIWIPKSTRKMEIKIDVAQKISNGDLFPFYIIFQDSNWATMWPGMLSKKNKDTIDIPKGAAHFKLDIGVTRSKASGEATIWWLRIIFK